MTRLATAGLLALLTLCVTSDATAQDGWEEPGLWISGGGGFGLANIDCTRCSTEQKGSVQFLLGIGGSASTKVRFGVEGVAWIESSADTNREYFGATAIAQFFLFESLPLHFQGGLGGGRYAEEGGGDLLEATGFNVQIGAGYDLHFTRNLSARIFARYLFSNGLKPKLNRQVQFGDLGLNILSAGVALTWQKL